jgi:tetratricopeptide (TPR) repeat protein
MEKPLRIDSIVMALFLALCMASTVRAQDPAEWFFRQGVELERAGKVSQALRFYEKALEKNKRHHQALFAAGATAYELGRYGRAEKTFKALAEWYPDDVRAQLYLARIALHTGEFEYAKIGFLKYLVKHPQDTSALIGLGRAEYLSGNCKAGSYYFDQAIASKSGDPEVERTVRHYQLDGARTCKEVQRRLKYVKRKGTHTDIR